MTLRSNHFITKTANDQPFYQYQVDYDPPIDNRRLRVALLWYLRKIVGQTRVFDGMILYLPINLYPPAEGWLTSVEGGQAIASNVRVEILSSSQAN